MIEVINVFYHDQAMDEQFESYEEAGLNEWNMTAICTLTSATRQFGIEFEVHNHERIHTCEVWFK